MFVIDFLNFHFFSFWSATTQHQIDTHSCSVWMWSKDHVKHFKNKQIPKGKQFKKGESTAKPWHKTKPSLSHYHSLSLIHTHISLTSVQCSKTERSSVMVNFPRPANTTQALRSDWPWYVLWSCVARRIQTFRCNLWGCHHYSMQQWRVWHLEKPIRWLVDLGQGKDWT